jgi:hypothetical protein
VSLPALLNLSLALPLIYAKASAETERYLNERAMIAPEKLIIF